MWRWIAKYCKIGLQCTQSPELKNTFDDEIDSVWLKVKTKNKNIVLGTIYKPPDANNTRFIDSLEEVLMHASVCQSDVIITGDFNINWHDSYCDKTKLQTVMEYVNLSQIIKGSTNIGLTTESCIDLLLSSNNLKNKTNGIIFNPMHNGITCHNFIYISVQTAPLRAARQVLYKRDLRNSTKPILSMILLRMRGKY